MKTLVRSGAFLSFVLACVLLFGCAGGPTPPMPGPGQPAFANDTIRPGDKITIQLSGVPDGGYFVDKQISANGEFSLPYLSQPFQVQNKNTDQLEQEIAAAYRNQKIYSSPVVNVLAEQEPFIIISGEVRSPSNLQYRTNLTLVAALNSCGGFTDFANRKSVQIIRGSKVFYINAQRAYVVPDDDPPVYPGDKIYVSRTVF